MKNEKALNWFNKLNKHKREELSFEYYGTDILLNEDIEKIYLSEYKYFIEFDGKRRFLCLFPEPNESKNKDFKSLNEALDYMLIEQGIKEVTIKN